MSVFSKILGSLRREAGMSQRKAAQELGVSQALLSHYENGAREPKLEFVARACSYYGVTADHILGRADSQDGVSEVTLKRCPNGAESLIDTVRDVFARLHDIGDGKLTELTIRYLAVSVENVSDLLKDPNALYDAMRDAEFKTIEAQLVTCLRNMCKETNNQGCSDD